MDRVLAQRSLAPLLAFVSLALPPLLAPPAKAQMAPLDLLGRIATLEKSSGAADASLLDLGLHAARTEGLLDSLGDDVGSLRVDLGTFRDGLGAAELRVGHIEANLDLLNGATGTNDARLDSALADVVALRGDVANLRGLLEGADLGIVDIDGDVDLGTLLGAVNRQAAAITANAQNLATANVEIGLVQSNDVRQDVRIENHERQLVQNARDVADAQVVLVDHERRFAENERDVASNIAAISDLQSRMGAGFADVDGRLRDHDRRIDKATEGVAMAFAMKSPAVPENKDFAVSGSFGAFDEKTALAFAGGVRATEALQFDAGVAVGLDSGRVGGRAGATFAW